MSEWIDVPVAEVAVGDSVITLRCRDPLHPALAKDVPENRLITGTREALTYVAKKILTKNQAKAARRKARGR